MTIERAHRHLVHKPWGSADLGPWNDHVSDGRLVGEIWFERPLPALPSPDLLLKLLFTSQPLSIQVHPDDVVARSMGLPNGKSEAWYVLSASPGAKVAVGLKRRVDASHLRDAIEDGSIANLVYWRGVKSGDVIPIAAGTIHAIGAGLVIAEIQQRSDTTFRLFDYGRQRGLDTDKAIAAAVTCPADGAVIARPLSDGRTLLIASPHFVLERFDLDPNTLWNLDAPGETWLVVLAGSTRIGELETTMGEGLYLDADRVIVSVGPNGLQGLVAYRGPDVRADMMHTCRDRAAIASRPPGAGPELQSRGVAS